MKNYLSVREVALKVGYRMNWVYTLINEKRIDAVKDLNGKWKVDMDSVKNYLQQQAEGHKN